MSRILITGASGAMGYYLARHIQGLNEGHVVYGTGRKPADTINLSGLDFYKPCDLSKSRYDAEDILYWATPDMVFHIAGNAHVGRSFQNPDHFLSDNVNGTLAILSAVVRCYTPDQFDENRKPLNPKFVLCSSSEVYGNVPQEQNPIKESQSADFPTCNPYAATKAMQEILCSTYSRIYGFPLIITRAFGYINPRRSDLVATALARQIVDVERGKASEVVHGDLRPVRSFADARDIAAAYWLAATKCEPGVYNIGSEEPCSIGELLQKIASLSETFAANRRQADTLTRPTDIFYCTPDCAKFRAATGWTPKYTLDESLKWLLEEVRGQ